MKIELPLTPEQEESLLYNLISSGSLYMDITVPDCPSPFTSLDIMYRTDMGEKHKLRYAIPQDIPYIRQFFEEIRRFEEGVAK